MAFPTQVNGQITDAVAQVSVGNTGAAPALASSLLHQVWAQAMGLQMQNATARQQHDSMIADALLGSAVQRLKRGGAEDDRP
ncbi:MAG: RebB family R body protein [Alphaproteobacteria bacterium]|nr:RebB family R body protein [Alphaproteobacteria bacterium]